MATRKPFRLHRIGQALALLGGLAATGAWAQATPAPAAAATAADTAGAVQQIQVTARKRSELAIDVPISIQAFSEKTLRETGVYDLQDLRLSSGFTLNQTAGTTSGGRTLGNLSFRGLQGDSGFLANESSGGLFLDGIYISTGVGSVNTRDVARVEVLKGPQNAFFGRNTFGGAINFITKNPSGSLRGEVNGLMTQYGSSDIDATLEGALVPEVLTGRVTVLSHRKAAPYRASDGGELGAENTVSLSGTLYATPIDKLWLRLRGTYQQDNDSMPAVGYLQARNNSSCNGLFFNGSAIDGTPTTFTPYRPTANAFYICGSIPKLKDVGGGVIDANTTIPAGARNAFVYNSLNDPFRAKTPDLDHGGLRRNVTRGSFQAGYELPAGAELAFNIGYNKANSSSIWDLDRSTSLNYLNLLALATDDLTADLRVSSDAKAALRGLVGVSYFKQTYHYAQLNFDNYATTIRDPNNFVNTESKVPAFYGSVEYDILRSLTISGDVRRQSDEIVTTAFSGGATYANTAKNWLPRVALRFKPEADTTIYATAAKGVQQLASNTGYINANATVRAYIESQVPGSTEYTPQPELNSVELGIKQSLMGNRLQYALAIYDQKWKNRLTNTVLLCPPGQNNTAACPLSASGTSVAFGNDATIRGLELSIAAVASSQWSFGAYIDYKHARWDKYYSGSFGGITGTAVPRAVRFDGNTIARVPELTGTFNATFRTALTAGWSGYARGDIAYTGKAWESDLNIVQTDPFYRVNLRLGVDKGDTTVEVFVKNLFNDRSWDYAHRVADLSGPFPGYFTQGFLVAPPPQREIGLRLRYAF